jgi:TnpA family transposase
MRRGTLTQLNRGEGRHSVARVVFGGRRGEPRQRYREGQEDQLGALGLVVANQNRLGVIPQDAKK